MNQLKVSVTDSGNTTELRTGEDICALVETANMPFDGFAKGVVDMFFDEADQDKGGLELLIIIMSVFLERFSV